MGGGKSRAVASVRRVLCVSVSSNVVVSRKGTGLVVLSIPCFVLTVPMFSCRAGTFVIKYFCIVVQFLKVWCHITVFGSIVGNCLMGNMVSKYMFVWTKSSPRLGPVSSMIYVIIVLVLMVVL